MAISTDQSKKGRVGVVDSYVGKKLKERRILLGFNQQELAECVDVSVQQIQKYESAKNRVSSGKLYGLAKLLRVPVAYFFEGIEGISGTLSQTENSQTANNFLAEDQTEFENDKDKISDKELFSLIKSYSKIGDPSKRKGVLDLLKTLSKNPIID